MSINGEGLMNILWVRQEDPMGCTVACLAMIVGKTYQQVRSTWPDMKPDEMLDAYKWQQYLFAHGFVTHTGLLDQHARCRGKEWTWPPEPFAEVHQLLVKYDVLTPHYHSVLWMRNGDILDPITPKIMKLSNYAEVSTVHGIEYDPVNSRVHLKEEHKKWNEATL